MSNPDRESKDLKGIVLADSNEQEIQSRNLIELKEMYFDAVTSRKVGGRLLGFSGALFVVAINEHIRGNGDVAELMYGAVGVLGAIGFVAHYEGRRQMTSIKKEIARRDIDFKTFLKNGRA